MIQRPQPVLETRIAMPRHIPGQDIDLRQRLEAAVQGLNGRRPRMEGRPSRVTTLPARADVGSLAKPEAYDRWNAGIRAADSIGETVITMYDVIGEDWWTGGGVTVSRIDAALRKIGAQDVEVHINSPGGDMFEGIAIYNRLLEHPGKVTVKVMGLAASAASIIAMAGEEILIGPASFLMIHNCWVMAMGNRHDMAATAEYLAPFDDAVAAVYAERSGMSKKDVAALMDAETWMNGETAINKGFADGMLSSKDVTEDPITTEQARSTNALRQAEISLCKGGSTRAEARALLNKIKGTPGAAHEVSTPGAGDENWLGDAVQLSQILKS